MEWIHMQADQYHCLHEAVQFELRFHRWIKFLEKICDVWTVFSTNQSITLLWQNRNKSHGQFVTRDLEIMKTKIFLSQRGMPNLPRNSVKSISKPTQLKEEINIDDRLSTVPCEICLKILEKEYYHFRATVNGQLFSTLIVPCLKHSRLNKLSRFKIIVFELSYSLKLCFLLVYIVVYMS